MSLNLSRAHCLGGVYRGSLVYAHKTGTEKVARCARHGNKAAASCALLASQGPVVSPLRPASLCTEYKFNRKAWHRQGRVRKAEWWPWPWSLQISSGL